MSNGLASNWTYVCRLLYRLRQLVIHASQVRSITLVVVCFCCRWLLDHLFLPWDWIVTNNGEEKVTIKEEKVKKKHTHRRWTIRLTKEKEKEKVGWSRTHISAPECLEPWPLAIRPDPIVYKNNIYTSIDRWDRWRETVRPHRKKRQPKDICRITRTWLVITHILFFQQSISRTPQK
jgi:hypothetical protein